MGLCLACECVDLISSVSLFAILVFPICDFSVP